MKVTLVWWPFSSLIWSAYLCAEKQSPFETIPKDKIIGNLNAWSSHCFLSLQQFIMVLFSKTHTILWLQGAVGQVFLGMEILPFLRALSLFFSLSHLCLSLALFIPLSLFSLYPPPSEVFRSGPCSVKDGNWTSYLQSIHGSHLNHLPCLLPSLNT